MVRAILQKTEVNQVVDELGGGIRIFGQLAQGIGTAFLPVGSEDAVQDFLADGGRHGVQDTTSLQIIQMLTDYL